MTIDTLKNDLIETLEGIDKDRLDLCSLKTYAEIVKTTSEIKNQTAMPILDGSTTWGGFGGFGGGPKMLTIGDMREKEEEDD